MIALTFHLNGGHIEIKTASCVASCFAFSGHTEPMQFLFKGLKVLNGLGSLATLAQKVLELIHGVRVTGQESTALQCLHGDSPLVEVMKVIAHVFQSGEAPSRGPARIQEAAEEAVSMSIHQYETYTHTRNSVRRLT
jgi:hypothetical protein